MDITFYNQETQVLSAFEPFLTIFKFLKTLFGYRGTLPRLLAGHVEARGVGRVEKGKIELWVFA